MKKILKKVFSIKNIIIFSVVFVICAISFIFGPRFEGNNPIGPENRIGYHDVVANHVQMRFTDSWINPSVAKVASGNTSNADIPEYILNSDTFSVVYAEDYYKGKENPSMLCISYLTDQSTDIALQAANFMDTIESDKRYKLISKEQTTWEDIGRYYYLNKDPLDDSWERGFPSYEWDITVWKCDYIDKDTNKKCEVLFFERTDGFYKLEMNYPRSGKIIKQKVYSLFEDIYFNIDLEITEKVKSDITYTQELQADGTILVTVTNNGPFRLDLITCSLSYTTGDGVSGYWSTQESYVQPDKTIIFTVPAEIANQSDSKQPSVCVYFYGHDRDDGELWPYT